MYNKSSIPEQGTEYYYVLHGCFHSIFPSNVYVIINGFRRVCVPHLLQIQSVS